MVIGLGYDVYYDDDLYHDHYHHDHGHGHDDLTTIIPGMGAHVWHTSDALFVSADRFQSL